MSNEHTGVSEAGDIPYTYEHVDEIPEPEAEMYKVTCIVELSEQPTHKNAYYVESGGLDHFFNGYDATGERVIDIRPIEPEQAEQELDEYRHE